MGTIYTLEPYFVIMETCIFKNGAKYASKYDLHHT